MAQARKTYRQMADELAELVAWFDSGEVEIDEAIAKFEQAMELIGQMEDYLKTAEIKIKKITATFE